MYQHFSHTDPAFRGIRPQAPGVERRQFGRVNVGAGFQCNLGRVLDLSRTGMRVLSHKAMCGVADVTLLAPGVGMHIPVEIVWSRRVGFRKHLLGVRFLNIDVHQADILTQLVSYHLATKAA